MGEDRVGGGPSVADQQPVDLAALRRLASALWRTLPPGAVVWLSGDLGSGKTTFVQALTEAAGATPATSPSYALIHEYACPEGIIYHVDCYRLNTPDEAHDLDLPGMAEGGRLLLIEWPERAGALAPEPDVHLRFGYGETPDTRYVRRAP